MITRQVVAGIFTCCMLGMIAGCGVSANIANYRQCLPLLEKERREARIRQDFSYPASEFQECRAPAHYTPDAD